MTGPHTFLKHSILCVFFFTAFAHPSTPATAQENTVKPLIVILSFSPLRNRKYNNSDLLTQKIRALTQTNDPIDFHFCTLSATNPKDSPLKETDPGPSPKQAKECIQLLEPRKPTWIIAMGETNYESHWIRFETIGYNLWRDIDYQTKAVPLLSGAAERLASTFPYHELFCSAETSLQKKLIASTQPGLFACNQILYELLLEYKEIPVGFLHVDSKLNETALNQLASWVYNGMNALHSKTIINKESNSIQALLKHAGYPLSNDNRERWIEIFQADETLLPCEKSFAMQFRSLKYD